jgi:23S rRNA pseudouridine1911/1915/1917 synthase
MITDRGAFTIVVDEIDAGKRLDVLIAACLSDLSRSFLAHLITAGRIRVQGKRMKPGYRVKSGDRVEGMIPPPEPLTFRPEPIPIEILFEDEHMVVINKQPGQVVHPAPGHTSGTLVNALLYHCPTLGGIGGKIRPGIVHRLDKDTSGVLVVAKNDRAHQHLSAQFKTRNIKKEYLALVHGVVADDIGRVSLPIGRHPVDRKKMSTVSCKLRTAETYWQVKARYEGASLLTVDLKTGRTHQIRVHLSAIGHPIVGDPVYGGRNARKRLLENRHLAPFIKSIHRQMLHARRLEFVHPFTEKPLSFEAPVPEDMSIIIESLNAGSQH